MKWILLLLSINLFAGDTFCYSRPNVFGAPRYETCEACSEDYTNCKWICRQNVRKCLVLGDSNSGSPTTDFFYAIGPDDETATEQAFEMCRLWAENCRFNTCFDTTKLMSKAPCN